ncbi:MAG: sulfite exporter TauE/SafE family protein, partial [Eudoraea sp.]|nr:sulfite exporter TauE/SafE family protein [Eudoraea sp.]
MVYTAFLLGLLGSLHCVGMCGPIAFMLPLSRDNKARMFGQLFLYHFGRILTYSIMGLAFGFFGKGLYLFGAQQNLSIIIGAI